MSSANALGSNPFEQAMISLLGMAEKGLELLFKKSLHFLSNIVVSIEFSPVPREV